jgi:unsaturated rhamnogalacturonyl hydrolase
MERNAAATSITPADMPWSERMAASALERYSLPDGRWDYRDGLLISAVHHLWKHTGDRRYWECLAAYVNRHVDPSGGIDGHSPEEYSLDQINPGKLLFPLYRATGQERYRTALWRLREQLRTHPRTQEGGFWHKRIYPHQMWLDGIYMSAPFYSEFAFTFNEPAAYTDLAFQITILERHTRDPESGLLYHGWDESREQRWADPVNGCSPQFWSRGIGWYVMAIVDVLDHFPEVRPDRYELIAILERTLAAVARVQDEESGLWWQVLDQPRRPGNYLEASGTSMFVYAIAKAVRNGHLPQIWMPIATRGFQGLLEHLVTLDPQGRVDLHGTCASAGLGGNPYRDGSYEYYVGERVATNDLHGVGAFILAALEMEAVSLRPAQP